MKKLILFAILSCCALIVFSQNNTCFRKPEIWLRADKQGNIPGQWLDASGHGYNAIVNNNQVMPDSGLFNYNKCFVFDSSSQPLTINYKAKPTARMLVFAVYKTNTAQNEKGIWNLMMDYNIKVKLTTKKMKNIYKVIKYRESTLTNKIINLIAKNWKNKQID